MQLRALRALGAAALLAAATQAATAAPTTYFGLNAAPAGLVSGAPLEARTQFLAGLAPSVTNQGFEGFAVGTNPGFDGLNLSFAGSAGSIQATVFGDGSVANVTADGRFNTTPGGTKWWETAGNFEITFSTAIAAFGFYATDVGDFAGRLELELTDTAGATSTLMIGDFTGGASGSLLFFGFIDTAASYTALNFRLTGAGLDFFGFDDMVIGDPGQIGGPTPPPPGVPEPGTLALVGLSLGALAWSRRRKPSAA
jgi:hypothetical protein